MNKMKGEERGEGEKSGNGKVKEGEENPERMSLLRTLSKWRSKRTHNFEQRRNLKLRGGIEHNQCREFHYEKKKE